MDHIETIDAIVALANTGRQLSTDEALAAVVRLIGDMCPTSQSYDSRLAALMQIGATLWNASSATRAIQKQDEEALTEVVMTRSGAMEYGSVGRQGLGGASAGRYGVV